MKTFTKYLYWATIGLFVYMPFHIFITQWLSTYTGGLDGWKLAKDVFTALLVSILVCTVLISRKYTKNYLYLVGFAVAYFVLHLILLFGTNQPVDTGLLATVYNNRIVWYLLIGYSLALLIPKQANTQKFIKVLLICSAIVSTFAIIQRFLPSDFLTHFGYSVERGVKPNFFIDDKPDLPRVFSTIRDPNSLGAFLILPSTLALGMLIRFWKDSDKRMLYGGILMLHGLALLLTFGRGAWIGTIIAHGVLVLFLFRAWIKKHFLKLALTGLAGVVLLVGLVFVFRDQYFIQNVVFHADESTTMDDPNELRVKLTQKTFDGIAANPEGNGTGTAGLVSTRLPNGGLLTENYYTQIAYEVGVVGLVMFLSLLVFVFKGLWAGRTIFENQALIASFVGLSVVATLFHLWSNEAVAASWWMVAGLALITTKLKH